MSTDPDKTLDSSIRTQLVIGSVLAAILVFGVGGWSALTSIESAVIAPATVVVEASKKAVQHDAGGIISQINVKNGDKVRQGDVLFRLDGTQVAAEIAALKKRTFDYTVRRHRLVAEREGNLELGLPLALALQAAESDELREIVSVQHALLKSRLGLRRGQEAQLRQRVGQFEREVAGLERVRQAIEEELALFSEEIIGLGDLKSKNLVSVPRYNALRRGSAEKRGALGRTITDIARTQGRITETRLQIIELDVKTRSETLKELESIEAELAQLTERLRAANDRFDKLDIRASDPGVIHELAVHTVGGVIRQGEVLASIVPTESKLVVDATVQTIDRDQIYPGMPARVRFTAFSQRTTPELSGTIAQVASDQASGRDGVQPYYAVRIALTPSEIARLGGLEITPGMPAEVMMTAQPRTVLSYLMKPMTDQFNRAFRDE